MAQNLYKLLFWLGYSAVLLTSVLKINMSLDKVHVNLLAFKLRLDHLLHFLAYFLIYMYFLAGRVKGLKLFETHALKKFILVTLVLATVTEFVQLWVPARSFNVMDMVSNVSGIIFGVVLIRVSEGRWKMQDGRRKMEDH